jgi:hypothetical protein
VVVKQRCGGKGEEVRVLRDNFIDVKELCVMKLQFVRGVRNKTVNKG